MFWLGIAIHNMRCREFAAGQFRISIVLGSVGSSAARCYFIGISLLLKIARNAHPEVDLAQGKGVSISVVVLKDQVLYSFFAKSYVHKSVCHGVIPCFTQYSDVVGIAQVHTLSQFLRSFRPVQATGLFVSGQTIFSI